VSSTSKPPAGPGYQPPAEPADSRRYVEYLESKGRPTSELREDTGLRVGDWRFCYRDTGGPRREDAAGLDSLGHAVDGYTPSDWYEFLSEPDLDADRAHRRIAWLLGRPGPVGPGYRFDDADVASMVGPPTLERDLVTATFEGWVIYPPEMQSPHRLRIAAHSGARATIDSTLWSKVKSK
jgi:hypothetical protein